MINLIIIVLSWSSSTFCFYITSFYIKYLPGDVYMNVIILCIADALSSIGAGVMSTALGAKRTLFLSFLLSSIGGFFLILAGKQEHMITILVLITRYGINSAFTLCYLITADYFPSIISSQIFGICNVFSRFSTIMAPLIAEVDPPIPMLVYCLVCTMTTFASMFLTKNEEIEEAMNDIDDSFS